MKPENRFNKEIPMPEKVMGPFPSNWHDNTFFYEVPIRTLSRNGKFFKEKNMMLSETVFIKRFPKYVKYIVALKVVYALTNRTEDEGAGLNWSSWNKKLQEESVLPSIFDNLKP